MSNINHGLLIFFLLAFFTSTANAQNWLWAKSANGGYQNEGWSATTDREENAYVAGISNGFYLHFGQDTVAGSNYFLAKYDSLGNILWVKSATNDSIHYANVDQVSVSTDVNNNVFLAGTFNSYSMKIDSFNLNEDTLRSDELFIVKYDKYGNVKWVNRADGSLFDYLHSATDRFGNLYIVGAFSSNRLIFDSSITLTNVSGYDYFLVKYSSTGKALWAKDYHQKDLIPGIEFGITTDAFNHIYIAGTFGGDSISFSPYVLHTDDLTLKSFLVKLDLSGNVLWARGGDGFFSAAGEVSVDGFGNIFLTGNFGDSLLVGQYLLTSPNNYSDNTFIAKYDSTGNVVWAKSLLYGYPYSISTDIQGNSYISGRVTDSSYSIESSDVIMGSDTIVVPDRNISSMYIAKFDENGNFSCGEVLEGGSEENSVAIDKSGNAYIIGEYYSLPFNIGSYNLTYDTITIIRDDSIKIFAPINEIFVAKFNCDAPSGINKINQKQTLLIFPNPTCDWLHLSTDIKEGNISIINILGQHIYESRVSSLLDIDVSNIPGGIYLLQITTQEGSVVRKWIKE